MLAVTLNGGCRLGPSTARCTTPAASRRSPPRPWRRVWWVCSGSCCPATGSRPRCRTSTAAIGPLLPGSATYFGLLGIAQNDLDQGLVSLTKAAALAHGHRDRGEPGVGDLPAVPAVPGSPGAPGGQADARLLSRQRRPGGRRGLAALPRRSTPPLRAAAGRAAGCPAAGRSPYGCCRSAAAAGSRWLYRRSGGWALPLRGGRPGRRTAADGCRWCPGAGRCCGAGGDAGAAGRLASSMPGGCGTAGACGALRRASSWPWRAPAGTR